MATEKTFALVGEFRDNITPKLRKLNADIKRFADSTNKEFGRINGAMIRFKQNTESASVAVRELNKALKDRPKSPFQGPKRADIAAMRTYAREVGRTTAALERMNKATGRKGGVTLTTRNIVENRTTGARRNLGGGGGGGRRDDFRGFRSGGLAGGVISGIIGGQATLLAFGIMEQIRSAVGSAMSFAADRFREGLADQIDDLQMQGRTVGRLRIEGLLGNTLEDYKYGAQLTRDIQRQVSRRLANSAADSDLVLRLFKQLSDNFIPALINDPKIRGTSQEGLGERVGEELGVLFERIALMTPQNYDVGFVSRAITKLIEEGKITGEIKRIDFFETNPGLLANINEAEFEAANLTDRVRMFNAAMMKVMPEEALTELNNSLGASIRAVRNNLLSIDIGLMSLGADLQGRAFGAKSGQPLAANMLRRQQDGSLKEVEVLIRTPMELINTKLSPALFALGRVLRTITDTFGPLTQALGTAFNRVLGPILNRLTLDLDAMASSLNADSIGEALGQLAGRLGTFALDALNALTTAGGGFFAQFKRGFDKTMGGGKFGQLIDRVTEILGDAIGRFFTFIVPIVFGAFGKAMQTLVTKGGVPGMLTAATIGAVLVSPILSGLAHIGELIEMSMSIPAIGKRVNKLKWYKQFFLGKKPSASTLSMLPESLGIGKVGRRKVAGNLLKNKSGFREAQSLSRLWKGLDKTGPVLERFLQGTSTASKYLSKFGKGVFIVNALFSGLSKALKGGSLAEIIGAALAGGSGAALGGAIGFALGGPIGSAIGSVIGASLTGGEAGTRAFTEAVEQSGMAIGGTFEALGSSVSSVIKIFASLFDAVFGTNTAMGDLKATTIGLKIALTPVVAAFQFIEQVANALASGLKGLELAVHYARMGLSMLNPAADPKKRQEIRADIFRTTKELEQQNKKFYESNARHMKWYETEMDVSGLTPSKSDMDWYNSMLKENGDVLNALSTDIVEHSVIVDKNGKLVTDATKLHTDAVQRATQEISGFTKGMSDSSNRMSSLFRMTPGAPGMPGGGLFNGNVPTGDGKIVELGNWLKNSGIAPAGVTEHPSFGGVGKHAKNSYHYSGRAIDIPAWSWEQGPIISAIQQWATLNNVQLKELLHAGNDANHMDHVHVAFARGMSNGRYFGSWQDALSYERHMMPAGTKAVYNSGEVGRNITIGDVVIHTAATDAHGIAEVVAAEILSAVRQAESSTIA